MIISVWFEGGVNGAQSGRWSSYEYLGSTPSALIPNASMGVGAELTVDEIRSVASNSEHHYPPSLHAPLISSPDSYSYAGGMLIILHYPLFNKYFRSIKFVWLLVLIGLKGKLGVLYIGNYFTRFMTCFVIITFFIHKIHCYLLSL